MENRKLIVTKERKPKISSEVVAEGSVAENPIEEEESEVTSKWKYMVIITNNYLYCYLFKIK